MLTLPLSQVRFLIDLNYRTNYGTYTERIDTPYGELNFSVPVDDRYFNYLMHTRGPLEEALRSTAHYFSSRKRQPTLYITPLSEFYNSPVPHLKRWAQDSWMQLKTPVSLKPISIPSHLDIRLIDKSQEAEYIAAFAKGFGNPDDQYGALSEGYYEAEKAFFRQRDGMESLIVLCRVGGEGVGVVRAVYENDYAFVYALAVDKKHRTGGVIAQAMGNFIVRQLLDKGIENILIQTEADSALERLYRGAGFERIFTGTYYV